MQLNPYVIFVLISTLLSGAATIYAWRRRTSLGALYLSLLLMSLTVWSFGYAMELANTEKQVIYLWLKFEYLGIASLPLWCLLFGFQYTGMDRFLSHRKIIVFAVIPSISFILHWTNEWHGLFYTNVEPVVRHGITVLSLGKGIWYWVHLAYCYGSFLLMTALLLRMSWRRGPLYRSQTLIIILAALAPLISSILYQVGITPFPDLDLSPFTFVIMGILMIWGLFHYQLFNVIPVVRDVLIESMGDGLIVLDTDYRVIDINPAGRHLTGVTLSSILGRSVDVILLAHPELLAFCLDDEKTQQEITWGDPEIQYLDAHIIRLKDRKGNKRGKLVILHDITARKRLEAEREQLIESLQEALVRVKTLSGLLPICASCKKIRDDQGYWHQVEVYIRDRSDAKFTHGICPACAEKLYPELYINKK